MAFPGSSSTASRQKHKAARLRASYETPRSSGSSVNVPTPSRRRHDGGVYRGHRGRCALKTMLPAPKTGEGGCESLENLCMESAGSFHFLVGVLRVLRFLLSRPKACNQRPWACARQHTLPMTCGILSST